jgi:hypothetical protein
LQCTATAPSRKKTVMNWSLIGLVKPFLYSSPTLCHGWKTTTGSMTFRRRDANDLLAGSIWLRPGMAALTSTSGTEYRCYRRRRIARLIRYW